MLICLSCALEGILAELLTVDTLHPDGTVWFSTACHVCSAIHHFPPS